MRDKSWEAEAREWQWSYYIALAAFAFAVCCIVYVLSWGWVPRPIYKTFLSYGSVTILLVCD